MAGGYTAADKGGSPGNNSASAPGTGTNIARQNTSQSDDNDYSVIVDHQGTKTSGSREPYVGPATYEPTTRPASELVNEWRHADAARITTLQQQLVDAGLLGPKDYTPG